LQGANSRITGSTITGLGAALSTQRGYGVWAINHVPVMIDGNVITGTGIDGIGADGNGTVITGNYVANCHWWLAQTGGQIVTYDNTNAASSISVTNNVVEQGGATSAGGLELHGNNVTASGNTIRNQYASGIGISSGKGFTVTGNTVLVCGLDASGNQDGVYVNANVTDFVISGNRIADDQVTPTMRWAIGVNIGTSDRYSITGNSCQPTNRPNSPITDGGTGVNKVISNNLGMDNVFLNSLASAATISIPLNPNIDLTGTTGITTVTGALWPGRQFIFWPTGIVTFTAGATIGNTFTTVANTPVIAIFDGTKLWLK
jgi:hypothetical protein